jgi:hypothetical protein
MIIRPLKTVFLLIALSCFGLGVATASWELVNDFETGGTVGVTFVTLRDN